MSAENPVRDTPLTDDQRRLEFERARRSRSEEVQTSPRRVYELIRSMIRRGNAIPEMALGEAELVQHLGASRNAVRRALQMLADDGVVVRQRRAGTSVLHDIVAVQEGEVGPRAYEGAADEGRLRVSNLECRRIATPPAVQQGLGSDVATVLVLEQVGFVGGAPLYLRVGYNVTDLSVEEFLRRIDLNHVDYPPIAQVFESLFDVPYGSSSSVVEAVSCEERAANLLGIAEGSPVLLRELKTRQTDGTPRELSFTHFRGDRVAIFGGDHTTQRVVSAGGFADLDLPLR